MSITNSDQYHVLEWTPEKIRSFWDWISNAPAVSDVYFTKVFGSGIYRHLIRRGIRLEGPVLDLGCGTGGMVSVLLQQHVEVAGMDASPQSVSQVMDRFGTNPTFLGAKVGKCDAIPFESNYAANVLLIETLEHTAVDESERIFRELLRVLKPGGRLIISVPNDEDLNQSTVCCPDCGAVFHTVQHLQSFNAKSMEKLFLDSGFELVFVEEVYFGYYVKSLVGKMIYRLKEARSRGNKPQLLGVATKR